MRDCLRSCVNFWKGYNWKENTMRKGKEKTAVEKAVEVLFESGIDSTAIIPTPDVQTIKQLKMRRV